MGFGSGCLVWWVGWWFCCGLLLVVGFSGIPLLVVGFLFFGFGVLLFLGLLLYVLMLVWMFCIVLSCGVWCCLLFVGGGVCWLNALLCCGLVSWSFGFILVFVVSVWVLWM